MNVTLQDPQTGRLIHLRPAQLEQKCGFCSDQMLGKLIVSIEGTHYNWVCFDHLQKILLSLTICPAFQALREVKTQLSGAQIGETIEVTRQMVALSNGT